VALERRGEATAQELGIEVPDLRKTFVGAEGKPYEAIQGVATRILMQLSADGHIVRGRPRGGWTSSQFTWAAAPDQPRPTAAAARAELARRWLHGFGPASRADLQWWTGWTAGQVKQALDQLEITEVDMDGTLGVMLAADEDAPPAGGPWVALLPALDPAAMGWRGRAWYVGEHAPALFDRSGNIGPTAWWDGRIVGGWAHRKDGEIAVRLLEDIGTEASAAIAAEAQRLREWIGADAKTRITPRFRTPLERELAG